MRYELNHYFHNIIFFTNAVRDVHTLHNVTCASCIAVAVCIWTTSIYAARARLFICIYVDIGGTLDCIFALLVTFTLATRNSLPHIVTFVRPIPALPVEGK